MYPAIMKLMQGSIVRLAVQVLMGLLVVCKEEPLQRIKRIKKSLQ